MWVGGWVGVYMGMWRCVWRCVPPVCVPPFLLPPLLTHSPSHSIMIPSVSPPVAFRLLKLCEGLCMSWKSLNVCMCVRVCARVHD